MLWFLITICVATVSGITVRDNMERIIKGFQPGEEDIPFQVGVMLHFDEGTGWCGGVLISGRYVLTSANCVRK